MKNRKNFLTILVLASLLHSSCATICGGSKYNAHIVVNNKPDAKIFYKGKEIGRGNATVVTKRMDANRFSFSVKQGDCEEEQYYFKSRTFRGWAFVGSIFTWTVLVNGVPIPVGPIIDLTNGSLWKPNVYEQNIVKQNYKNYKYAVEYTKSCATQKNNPAEKTDVIYLKNGAVIKGSVIEKIPGNRVQIRVAEDDIEVYTFEEIDRIE